jgi:nucleotide-binding universal stress UspA family protein
MKKILVPLDGSALADRAIPFAATLAARADWSLVLLRAVNTLAAPTEGAGAALKREAQASLEARAAALTADGVKVSTCVVDRLAEPAILEATADPDIGLIVMSTHGRSGLGRFVYGSVADTVLREAPVPVLTVPPHGLDGWPADRPVKILVPLDGSVLSTAALAPACELADILGGSLLLASIVTFPSYAAYAEGYVFADPAVTESVVAETRHHLEGIAARIRTETRPVEVCTTYGTPYFGITNIARTQGVGLIVMATHGRGGMTRALLGSVATATLRQTDVPIVLVRPDAVEQPEQAAEPASPEARAASEPHQEVEPVPS